LFVLFGLPGGVPGILLYLICMIIIPEEEQQ
jgi:phage shock protein PspC (stress-responsive transcriptional regulator)